MQDLLEPFPSVKLTILADWLEKNVQPNRFYMNRWTLDKDPMIAALGVGACGTTACIAGWAADIPAFRAAGFSLVAELVESEEGDEYKHYDIHPKYEDHEGMDALYAFFGLGRERTDLLFLPTEHYRSGECLPKFDGLPNANPDGLEYRIKLLRHTAAELQAQEQTK